METRVVNIKFEDCDIYIGRDSKNPNRGFWGNPYSHLNKSAALYKTETIDESLEKYEKYVLSRPDMLSRLPELEGKKLGCFCVDINGNGKCHGKILIKLLKLMKYKSLF